MPKGQEKAYPKGEAIRMSQKFKIYGFAEEFIFRFPEPKKTQMFLEKDLVLPKGQTMPCWAKGHFAGAGSWTFQLQLRQ